MSDANWVVPVAVVAGGLVGGFGMLLLTKKRDPGPARTARIAELRETKARLVEQLRALGPSDEGRASIEREAARVLRELDTLEPGASASAPAPVPAPAFTSAPAPAPAPQTSPSTTLSPQLVGALKGGLVVLLAFVFYLALRDGSHERSEGMGMTGGTGPERPAMGAPAPSAESDQPGQSGLMGQGGQGDTPMAERTAPSLAPIPSPRLDAARAFLDAHPDSHDAKVAFGWALVEAKGWIELYRLVESLVAQNQEDPDALALAAPVQLAMGQRQQAGELLDKVLADHPDHPQALVWRGRIAQLDGDAAAQAELWRRARATPSAAEVEAIIASFDSAPPPRPHGAPSAPPAGDAPSGGSGPGDGPGIGSAIQGTIKLAPGAVAPPGATLFIIARTAGVTSGPPLATRKIEAATFPRAFTLGPEDVMMQGMSFAGPLTLEARLDGDGNARTRDPGDLFASAPGPVEVGARGLVLELAHP